MGDEEEDTYASAAARGSAATPVPSPQPAAPVAGGSQPAFPPARPPPGHKVTALMAKAAAECPLCHQKHHGLAKCGYALRAGYVCQHKPAEAATQLAALNLGGGRNAATTQPAGEHPSASVARTSPAPPPPAPSPPPPASAPVPPKPQMADTADAEVQAAAAEILLEEISITDDETSLVEADGILPQGEANNNRRAVAPCTVAPTFSSFTPLAQACAAVTRQPARPLTSPPLSGTRGQAVGGRNLLSCPQGSRSVVTLRAPSTTRLAAAFVSASLVSAAAGSATSDVAILDSGATHHLWPTYRAFISYSRVYGQHVTLADNSEIRIAGRGTIAIVMGGKKLIIRDVYHVPDLRLPLFSLRVH